MAEKVEITRAYLDALESCKDELDRVTLLYDDAPDPSVAVDRVVAETTKLRRDNAKAMLDVSAAQRAAGALIAATEKETTAIRVSYQNEIQKLNDDVVWCKSALTHREQDLKDKREHIAELEEKLRKPSVKEPTAEWLDHHVVIPRKLYERVILELQIAADAGKLYERSHLKNGDLMAVADQLAYLMNPWKSQGDKYYGESPFSGFDEEWP